MQTGRIEKGRGEGRWSAVKVLLLRPCPPLSLSLCRGIQFSYGQYQLWNFFLSSSSFYNMSSSSATSPSQWRIIQGDSVHADHRNPSFGCTKLHSTGDILIIISIHLFFTGLYPPSLANHYSSTTPKPDHRLPNHLKKAAAAFSGCNEKDKKRIYISKRLQNFSPPRKVPLAKCRKDWVFCGGFFDRPPFDRRRFPEVWRRGMGWGE